MENIESENVKVDGLKELREQREKTIQKWQESGLLDGLEGNLPQNLARMFEGYLVCYIDNDNANDLKSIYEAFNSAAKLLQSVNLKDCEKCDFIDADELHDINMKLSEWTWKLGRIIEAPTN